MWEKESSLEKGADYQLIEKTHDHLRICRKNLLLLVSTILTDSSIVL